MADTFFTKHQTLNCSGNLLSLEKPKVMGIVNITPDSFYSASRKSIDSEIVAHVKKMLDQGAAIIDLGAYSSRPGAKDVSEDEEWGRLAPVLEAIRKAFPEVVLSVDTFRSSVARRSVKEYGVDIINDIAAGELDDKMFETVADLQVPYILMHMKGTPQSMQQAPSYEYLMKEVFYYFAKKTEQLKKMGVADMVIDPGFGFGKTLEHNYEILDRLEEFKIFELPVLVGFSRKSMIYKFLNTSPEEALNGTTVLNTMALLKGANILRVHDVKQAVEAVELYWKTQTYCLTAKG